MISVSILLPFRRDGAHRDRNLQWVLERYRQLFPDVEIVTQEDTGKTFWKTRAVNLAARRARGNILVQADADVFCEPKQLRDAIGALGRHMWAYPFTHYRALTALATRRVLALPAGGRIPSRPTDCKYTTVGSPAGLIVYRREAFEAVGGLDERFRGWGCEDTAFQSAMATVNGSPPRVSGSLWHLWHPRQRTKSTADGTLEKNQALRLRYQRAASNPAAMKALIAEAQAHAGH